MPVTVGRTEDLRGANWIMDEANCTAVDGETKRRPPRTGDPARQALVEVVSSLRDALSCENWLDQLAEAYGVDTFEEVASMFEGSTLNIPEIYWEDSKEENEDFYDEFYKVLYTYSLVANEMDKMECIYQMDLSDYIKSCSDIFFSLIQEAPSYVSDVMEENEWKIPQFDVDLSQVQEADAAKCVAVMLSISQRTINRIFGWFQANRIKSAF